MMQAAKQAAEGRLASYFTRLAARPAWRWSGRVVEANGQTVESEGPLCSVGECCEIVDGDGRRHRAEVIGFRGRHVLAMPLEATQGIRYGDALMAMGVTPAIAVGEEMEGRILECAGRAARWTAGAESGGDVAARWSGAAPDGARADQGAAADGAARARWNVDGRTRAEGGHLRRIGRGQEHVDRNDDAQYGGGSDGGGAGRRARTRGAGVC